MTVRAPLLDLAAGPRTLPSDVSRYVCRVLRLGAGASFVAFDPTARVEADVVIVEPSADAAKVTIGVLRPAPIIAGTNVALVYGLAKGDKVDAVVRDATELGATLIVIARTERAVAKIDEPRSAAKLERWRRVAEQAARQCGRADPPAIIGVLDWPDALDAAHAHGAERSFCLWEEATDPLGTALIDAIECNASLAFAIGPEGGLTAAEVEEARVRGFAAASLGRIILRTETVAAAVLGAVRVLTSARDRGA